MTYQKEKRSQSPGPSWIQPATSVTTARVKPTLNVGGLRQERCATRNPRQDDTLFMPIAVEHKDQNAKLMPFIEKRAKVTGTILEKGGLKGIAIKTVEPAP